MKIWNVPIEPLIERYSNDWNHWFPEEFDANGIEYETINGEELTRRIEQGSFLDVIGTNHFKASQIQKICRKIYSGAVKDGDVFLFHDYWFPGVESLAYIRDALGMKFKIVGLLHAGTWDKQDFLSHKGMDIWAPELEESWFQIADCIFVATEFHRNLLINSRRVGCPIHVTGFPIRDLHSNPDVEKEKVIVFPHRLDSEKQPEKFELLEKIFRDLHPDLEEWRFIKTKEEIAHITPNGLTSKEAYYSLLNKSRIAVSCALQETWGIAMQEALFAGCIPLVPDRLSYVEMYPPQFRYGTLEELAMRLRDCCMQPAKYELVVERTRERLLSKGHAAIGNMVDIIRKLR
jgi:glycosyltransferase involved in cell wall biosynthesis